MKRTVNVSQKALSKPLPTKWMTVGNGLYVNIDSSNNLGSTQFGFDIQFSNCDFRLAKAKTTYSGTIPSGIFQYSLPGNWAFEQIEGQPNWEMDSGDNYLAAGGIVFNDIQWPYFATGEEGVEGNLNLIMECDLDIKIYVEYGNSFNLESYDMCVLKCDNISVFV